MAAVPTARSVAARVLERVFEDQAFAAAALDAELSRSAQLAERDRALATELVYGVLRTHGALEKRIRRFAPRKIKDPSTAIELWLAAYQILLLDRVPAFAAVDAAVEAVRRRRGERMGGFANAVLRKLAASKERLTLADAVVESAPGWLVERLVSAVGDEQARALLGAGEVLDAPSVRLTEGHAEPEWLGGATPGKVASAARRFTRRGDLRRLAGYDEGAFSVQEEGAQVVALLLGAQPGERVLDACAGRGQKAALLAEQVGATGSVFATDLHPSKLDALAREFERLKLPLPERRAVDWSVGTADVPAGFDRVLVDAPCSGTGTLRHRPEILLRLGPEDPARLADVATGILRAAASRARAGGQVVFAVCSVLPEEGEAVVARVLDLLEPASFDAPALASLPVLVPPGATSLRLLPREHGTDGYFVASFRRRA